MFIGTGSVPPFARGLHLQSLFAVSPKPIKNPHSAKQSLAYIEQVGENLHTWGINGEMQNLNIATKNIAIFFGILIINLNTFFIVHLCFFKQEHNFFFYLCKAGVLNAVFCEQNNVEVLL